MEIFNREMELARNAGVEHPENFPFLLEPERTNGQGVLLVHGFCATPRELRELGDSLCRQGCTVFGVRLPGHGTSPEDLAERDLEEWLATVERGYQLLHSRQLKVCGVGLSTGALLLLKLALLRPFSGLVLLSPYLQLKHPLAPYAAILKRLIPYQLRDIPIDEHAFYYHRRPLHGVAQINRLCHELSDRLAEIETPALVLASAGDQTIAPGTARRLFEQLASEQKEFFCYGPEVPHVLTTAENPQQQDTFQRSVSFLNKTLTSIKTS
jgi:carboxylesterase